MERNFICIKKLRVLRRIVIGERIYHQNEVIEKGTIITLKNFTDLAESFMWARRFSFHLIEHFRELYSNEEN